VPPPLRRRPPPSRHVPWLSGCGWRRAEKWPRPRPVPPPERLRRGWVTEPARPRSRRSHQLGRVTRPGAGCGPPGGPNQGRVGGARKAESETRSKREAEANPRSGISVASSDLNWNFCCLFRSQESRFGCGPVHSVRSLRSGGPTPNECEAAHRPPFSAAAHPGRQCEVSTPIPAHRPGVSSPLRVTARSCQSCMNERIDSK
jgi:hypothetical protein